MLNDNEINRSITAFYVEKTSVHYSHKKSLLPHGGIRVGNSLPKKKSNEIKIEYAMFYYQLFRYQASICSVLVSFKGVESGLEMN